MPTPTTLPATFVSGNVLTAAQMNSLLGGFRITQFLTAVTTTEQSSSSTTKTDITSMSISITPQSATNKILVAYMTVGGKSVGNITNALEVFLLRGATEIAAYYEIMLTSSLLLQKNACAFLFLDAPATTSATTYKYQMKNKIAASNVVVQNNDSTGQMIVMEVSL